MLTTNRPFLPGVKRLSDASQQSPFSPLGTDCLPCGPPGPSPGKSLVERAERRRSSVGVVEPDVEVSARGGVRTGSNAAPGVALDVASRPKLGNQRGHVFFDERIPRAGR